jgi:hypothetical protein
MIMLVPLLAFLMLSAIIIHDISNRIKCKSSIAQIIRIHPNATASPQGETWHGPWLSGIEMDAPSSGRASLLTLDTNCGCALYGSRLF